MIVFLQLLSVFVPAAVALALLLLIVGVAVGGAIHGRGFTIYLWQPVLAGVFAALALALAAAYGWVSLP